MTNALGSKSIPTETKNMGTKKRKIGYIFLRISGALIMFERAKPTAKAPMAVDKPN